MLSERKLTERELDARENAIKGLMSNKKALVRKYGKDAEKVMYGIATKQAKKNIESMNKEKLKEMIRQSLLKKEGFVDTAPLGEPESGQEVDVDTGFSGRADYGAEDKYLGGEDEIEQAAANTPPSGGRVNFLPGVPTPKQENFQSRLNRLVREKLTKKHDVGDFVDDFKKSDAKQFRGKSEKKKKEMAVAAYLAKQND